MIQIDFYTRTACCLCGEALSQLQELQGAYPLSIRLIDVDSSPELRRRYGNEVPVAVCRGVELFRHRVSPEELRKRLDRLLRRTRSAAGG